MTEKLNTSKQTTETANYHDQLLQNRSFNATSYNLKWDHIKRQSP